MKIDPEFFRILKPEDREKVLKIAKEAGGETYLTPPAFRCLPSRLGLNWSVRTVFHDVKERRVAYDILFDTQESAEDACAVLNQLVTRLDVGGESRREGVELLIELLHRAYRASGLNQELSRRPVGNATRSGT